MLRFFFYSASACVDGIIKASNWAGCETKDAKQRTYNGLRVTKSTQQNIRKFALFDVAKYILFSGVGWCGSLLHHRQPRAVASKHIRTNSHIECIAYSILPICVNAMRDFNLIMRSFLIDKLNITQFAIYIYQHIP